MVFMKKVINTGLVNFYFRINFSFARINAKVIFALVWWNLIWVIKTQKKEHLSLFRNISKFEHFAISASVYIKISHMLRILMVTFPESTYPRHLSIWSKRHKSKFEILLLSSRVFRKNQAKYVIQDWQIAKLAQVLIDRRERNWLQNQVWCTH